MNDQTGAAMSRWCELNLPFESNKKDGFINGPPIRFVNRSSNVCLVAAHSVNHFTIEGEYKQADLFTGGLALLLGEKLAVNVVCSAYRDVSMSTVEGKRPIETQIWKFIDRNIQQAVLDIHGMRDNSNFDVAVGTNDIHINPHQIYLVEAIRDCCTKCGLTVAINPPSYQANSALAIVKRLNDQGHQRAIQIEIAARCRRPDLSNEKTKACLLMFCDAINLLREVRDYE